MICTVCTAKVQISLFVRLSAVSYIHFLRCDWYSRTFWAFFHEVTMMSLLSTITHKCRLFSGPLLLNDEYLLVADYSPQNVYQLQLNSDEVRALPMGQCRPVSLAFDPSIKCLYIICDEEYLYRIHKKTLDGNIDTIIYSAPQSTFANIRLSILLFCFALFILNWLHLNNNMLIKRHNRTYDT